VVPQAGVGTVQQARRHGQAVVRGREPFVEHRLEHGRQALAAILGRGRERGPAAIDEGPVGLAKARRRAHLARGETATLRVADAVQRRDRAADEAGRLLEHLRMQRIVDLGEGRERAQPRGRV